MSEPRRPKTIFTIRDYTVYEVPVVDETAKTVWVKRGVWSHYRERLSKGGGEVFETREQAVAAANRHLEGMRRLYAEKLKELESTIVSVSLAALEDRA